MTPWPVLERFWTELDTRPPVTADGYLVEMTPARRHEDVRPTAEVLARSPCRVLLGEAGVGKSTTLAEIARLLPPDDARLRLDFADASAADLRDRAFVGPAWEQWHAGTQLHLLFDSLDESAVAIDRGVAILRDGFRQLRGVERLTLTVACRPVAWPETLGAILRERWAAGYAKYLLCPLRRSDVERVLVAEDIAAPGFFAALDRMNAHHLAARPQTLRLLVRTYRRVGRLPADRDDLYREAVRDLCDEPNAAYRESRGARTLSPGQRLALARRVAAVCVLTGRASVWTGPKAECPETCVCVSDLRGGTETEEEETVPVETATLTEVLRDTGLFRPATAHVTWDHRTFAEFLTADYVCRHRLDDAVLDSLFLHPSRRGAVPQLAGTAGWIGADRPEWFARLAAVDPRVLFGLDPTAGTEAFRAWAVGSLLNAAAADRLNDYRVQDEEYRRFGCNGLGAVLRPFVANATLNVFARRMAFRIAAANGVTALVPDLLAVASTAAEEPHVRRFAARAVVDLSGNTPPRELLDLLRLPPAEDPDDELLGTAIDACWPRLLTTADVFEVLRPPHNPEMFGDYAAFLTRRLPEALSAADLAVALSWAASTDVPDASGLDPLTRARSAIIRRGYTRLDDEAVLTPAARVVWAAASNFRPLPGYDRVEGTRDLLPDDLPRRRLAQAVGRLASGTEDAGRKLLYARLVRPQDVEWLVDQLMTASDEAICRVWSDVAAELYRAWPCETLGPFRTLYHHAEAPTVFTALLRPLLEPVAVSSPEAERMRQDLARFRASEADSERLEQEIGSQRAEHERLGQDELVAAVTRLSEGSVNAWPRLAFALLVGQRRDINLQYAFDLTATPGWATLRPEDLPLLPEAAECFLSHGRPFNIYTRLAGLKALHYLRTATPNRFTGLPEAIWLTWLPAVVWYVFTDSEERRRLFAEAYRRLPDETLAAWREWAIQLDTVAYHAAPSLLFGSRWDDRTTRLVRQVLQDTALRPAVRQILWDGLLAQDVGADAEAAGALTSPPADAIHADDRHVVAAALMAHAPRILFSLLDRIEVASPGFFSRWMLHLAAKVRDDRWGTFLRVLTDAELGELYRRMHAAFPPAEDDAQERVDEHAVTPRDELAEWRSGVIGELEACGTVAACDVIAQLATAYPEADHLRWRQTTALGNVLEATWRPPTPADVRTLFREADRRLVRGAADLAAIILESLDRYKAELQGHTPSAFQLWNVWATKGKDGKKSNKYRPKEENRVSDAIALHLQRDLAGRRVAVNREVEVRPAQGGGAGERTDIHVVAWSAGRQDPVTVVIEVKGGWHAEVRTAMQTQLRDRYLADSRVTHGVYLVAWFCCPQWDTDDDRHADHRNRVGDVLAVTRQDFVVQASQLSQPPVLLRAVVLDASLR
ncbi:NACHT domain-containing protein [Limnoglobus roseus]|uniref:Uncharacterized protein n=1 Tax=Limnoglobus roseus TaxID=2598579 RepID=A0A5C1ARK2_9BACT|nr:hypothetical protein [Limnoglobus roseus]QEL19854.1 hypothetical protein PX52LOC_06935 [Limnoglobus roseus]